MNKHTLVMLALIGKKGASDINFPVTKDSSTDELLKAYVESKPINPLDYFQEIVYQLHRFPEFKDHEDVLVSICRSIDLLTKHFDERLKSIDKSEIPPELRYIDIFLGTLIHGLHLWQNTETETTTNS